MNAQNKCCYEFGSFRLNPVEHLLFHDGEVVSLTPKAFDTLLVLVENHGHLVEKDELLEKVWAGSFVEEANVAKHISILRKVLSGNGLEEPFIETIPTRGYRFVAPLTETEIEPVREIALEVETPHEVEDPDRSDPSATSSRRRGINAPILLVGIISMVVVLAVGGWYYLPSFIRNDGIGLGTTELSLAVGHEKVEGGRISPDGKLVAFRRIKPDEKSSLAVRRLTTGETIDLVSDLEHIISLPAFSPDSKFIYYFLHPDEENHVHPMYRVSVTGGPAEKIMDDGGLIGWGHIAVSPDGNQLAFIRFTAGKKPETRVVVADKEGKREETIYTTTEVVPGGYFPHVLWSGDGQRLLLLSRISGNKTNNLFAKWIDKNDKSVTDAKELEPLSERIDQKLGLGFNLVLLKDGSGYLFGHDRQVFHLSALDGKITQITNFEPGWVNYISVSDDGKSLVVNKGRSRYSNMVSYDPASKESTKLMNENRGLITWWGGFSQMPDGRILYSNQSGKETTDIYSMNKDGGNETRLTSDSGNNLNPVATRDGKYIVFRSNRSGANNLWRMDVDGSNPVRLTSYLQKEMDGITEFDLWNRSIQITNDGKTVLFAQQPIPFEKSKLMKIPINGGKAVELLPNSPTSNYHPRISPDGSKLAYSGYVTDRNTPKATFAIYIRSLNGDRLGEIENKFDLRGRPIWTPDGKSLTYMRFENHESNIWKIDIKTGEETALTFFPENNDIYRMFNWANDGKKILIIHEIWADGDTVLIRNRDISKTLF